MTRGRKNRHYRARAKARRLHNWIDRLDKEVDRLQAQLEITPPTEFPEYQIPTTERTVTRAQGAL